MMGLILLVVIALGGGWFAWLYFVSPASDQDRIKADQGGTDARLLDIKRVGTRHDRAETTWMAGYATPRTGGKWFRIYEVTVARPGGDLETYTVGVEATLLGLPDLKRFDLRA